MLVVIDTDILVSTAGHPDKRFAIWEAVRAGRMTAVTCDVAIAELEDVAARPVVLSALPLLAENVPLFLAEYRSHARIIPLPREHFVLQIDPKDSLFFNIAIEAQGEVLTTFNMLHILPVRKPGHPQNVELRRLAPKLRLLTPRNSRRKLSGEGKQIMKTARETRDDYLQLMKAFPLVPIKTEGRFDAALAVVKGLAMRGEDHLAAGEKDYLAALTFFVENYENKHYQIEAKDMEPVEALKYLMEESSMSIADLGRLLGNSRPCQSDCSWEKGVEQIAHCGAGEIFSCRGGAFYWRVNGICIRDLGQY